MLVRRPPLDDDDENPDRWLVSYADFITLLFAFFVVMYSISSVNQSKYNELMSSMGTAFSGQMGAGHLKTKGANANLKNKAQNQADSLIKPLPLTYLYNEKIRKERESMTNMGSDLANKLSPLIKEGKVRVLQNNRVIRIDINDSLLFKPGSAELAAAASTVLNEIAPLLREHERLIQVEGHTDNLAIHNELFYSNWELSAVRASSVVRMLSDAGIAEVRLSALGFGATQPITENSTELGRAKNRRVSIVILSDSSNQKEAALEVIPKTK